MNRSKVYLTGVLAVLLAVSTGLTMHSASLATGGVAPDGTTPPPQVTDVYHPQHSVILTSAVILLQKHGHADPMANEVFRKRSNEIKSYFEIILEFNENIDGLRANQDPEYIRRMINRLTYTLATDGNYILSDQWTKNNSTRQYNALVTIAEQAMSDALTRHDASDDIAESTWEEFRRILKHAEDRFATPRWACLHGDWGQEEMAFFVVKYKEYINGFDEMLDRSIGNLRAGNPTAPHASFDASLKSYFESFARHYAASALNFYAGMSGDISDSAAPLQSILECQGTVCFNIRDLIFHVEYDPGDDFDAMKILQEWWANPVTPAR